MSTKKNLELFQPVELIRGNVKAAMKDANAASSDVWKVPVDKLRFIENFNPRVHNAEYDAHIDFLAKSIHANGYYQDKPIAGFVAKEGDDQVIYVTDGHSRTLGARRAIEVYGTKLETLPVMIKPAGVNMEDLLVATVVSNEGRSLTPYEKALVVKRLIDMGIEEKVVAERLNITGQYVSDLLSLIGAPVAVRNLVANGKVAAALAVTTLKKHGSKAAEKLQAAVDKAAKQGKAKASNKHMTPTLKISGVVDKVAAVGSNILVIKLDSPLDVEVVKGNLAKLVLREDDSL